MNAIWSASHLQIKDGHSSGKMQVSMPVYGATAFESVSKGSPQATTHHHHHHKSDKASTSKIPHKHNNCCAVHKKDRRVKSSEEINQLKVVAPDKVKQSTSSSHIHSKLHYFTPEISRKNPFNNNHDKKKCTCGINKESPKFFNSTHHHKQNKVLKSHHSDEGIKQSKLTSSNSLPTEKDGPTDHSIEAKKQSEPATSSGGSVPPNANTTARYVFKETSV